MTDPQKELEALRHDLGRVMAELTVKTNELMAVEKERDEAIKALLHAQIPTDAEIAAAVADLQTWGGDSEIAERAIDAINKLSIKLKSRVTGL